MLSGGSITVKKCLVNSYVSVYFLYKNYNTMYLNYQKEQNFVKIRTMALIFFVLKTPPLLYAVIIPSVHALQKLYYTPTMGASERPSPK